MDIVYNEGILRGTVNYAAENKSCQLTLFCTKFRRGVNEKRICFPQVVIIRESAYTHFLAHLVTAQSIVLIGWYNQKEFLERSREGT